MGPPPDGMRCSLNSFCRKGKCVEVRAPSESSARCNVWGSIPRFSNSYIAPSETESLSELRSSSPTDYGNMVAVFASTLPSVAGTVLVAIVAIGASRQTEQ